MSEEPQIRTSFWEKEHFFVDRDIVVVGGGLVGLCTAIFLKERNPALNILVVDAQSIPLGASTRNAGFACMGSPSEILDDLGSHNMDEICALIEKRYVGLQKLIQVVGVKNLRFEETGGFEVFRSADEETYSRCLDLVPKVNKRIRDQLGFDLYQELTREQIDKTKFKFAIGAPKEGLIDPGAMIKSLLAKAASLKIDYYAGLKCTNVFDNGHSVEVVTGRGSTRADQVILATNGFSSDLVPETEIIAVRNQVLVTSKLKDVPKGAFHYDRGYYYFRNLKDRILIGGGRNIAVEEETTSDFGMTPRIRANLINFLQENLTRGQSYAIEFEWSGILGLHKSKIPQVRAISPRITSAVGLGGMGIAIGAALAQEATDTILC